MNRASIRTAAVLSTIGVLVTTASRPAAAIHQIVGCSADGSLGPLVLMIHNIANLIFVVGTLAAVVSLAYAGIMIMWGSEDAKRRAISRVQRVLLGVGLLVVAPFIIAFLIAPFNGCTGGA